MSDAISNHSRLTAATPTYGNAITPLPDSERKDVFDQGIVTAEYAQSLLEEFMVMSRTLRYVLCPEQSISDFRRERPMLLLSIMTTSSWRDRPLQIILEKEYLNSLGVRMVVKGEDSLDMLQSLLVHLAWSVDISTLKLSI
jgi:hypothetical protein